MIELQLLPEQVIAGLSTELRLRVTNMGPGSCTDVVLTIGVPTGIIHIQGRDRLHVERLEAGKSADLKLRVAGDRPGRFTFTVRNLSYRDHRGQVRRVPTVEAELVVLAPRQPPPAPQVDIEVQTRCLPLGEWSDLRATVVNSGAVAVTDLVVSIGGRVTTDAGSRARRIGALEPGASSNVSFSIRPHEAGATVPLRFTLEFSGPAGPVQMSTVAAIAVAIARPPQHATEPAPTLRILVLWANPLDTRRLRPDEEFRRIEQAIRESRDRDSIQVTLCPAARGEDIVRSLLDVKPQFLHLSGHGADGTFVIEDDHGLQTSLRPEALCLLLRATGEDLRCVTVNACSTERLGRELAKSVPYVIAMRQEVLDHVAIQFSIAFYRAIVAGLEIERAFVVGQAAMDIANAGDLGTAVLFSRADPGAAEA